MSSISINDITSCANCGKGEEESDKLKSCTACKLVKYCSRECQIAHRPQHKKECRKRAAELHDEKLFKQPPPLYGDCPICFLRLPSLRTGSTYYSCCGKLICNGCANAPVYDNQGNEVDNEKCPFCRTPSPESKKEARDREKIRAEALDAIAIYNVGAYHFHGDAGFPQDYDKALELWNKAGELGDALAYFSIGNACKNGDVKMDEKKAIHYWELAAIGGNTEARNNLGSIEGNAGNMEGSEGNEGRALKHYNKALKHFMIAARDGDPDALENIKRMYGYKDATKDDYVNALRSYQVYLDEIKSDQRDRAVAVNEEYKYY